MTSSEHIVISVIVPVWNGAGRIAMTLDALAAQTADPALFEVIVVDNGSTDGTADIVRRYQFVTLLSEPQPGSYRARNLGMHRAKGEYVLFTDGDCVPASDWIEQALAAPIRYPQAGFWAGRITLFREAGAGTFCTRFEEMTAFNQEANARSGHCVTANWLCRLETMQSIGGFNADLLSGGDVECSRRLVAAGHQLAYVPEMTVGHPTRARLGDLIRKRRRVAGGRWHLEEMSSSNVLSGLKLYAREAYWQSRWTLRSRMEAWAKPGVVLIIGILMAVSWFEVLRLAMGHPPYRS